MPEIPFPEKITSLPRRLVDLYDDRDIAYRLETETVDICFATYPAGLSNDFHTHPTDNVGVVTAGKFTLIMDDREQSFGVGDWYYVPANKTHAARIEEDTVFVEFWFKE